MTKQCPYCESRDVDRIPRLFFMRLFSSSQRYRCRVCATPFLAFGAKTKVNDAPGARALDPGKLYAERGEKAKFEDKRPHGLDVKPVSKAQAAARKKPKKRARKTAKKK